MPKPRRATYMQRLAAMARGLPAPPDSAAESRVEYAPLCAGASGGAQDESTSATCFSFAWARADFSKSQAPVRVPGSARHARGTRLHDPENAAAAPTCGAAEPSASFADELGAACASEGASFADELEAARISGAGEPSASFADELESARVAAEYDAVVALLHTAPAAAAPGVGRGV